MRDRSSARLLAPLALLAVVVAVVFVVSSSGTSSGGTTTTTRPAATATKHAKTRRTADERAAKGRKVYHVKAGDTLSSIASATGVSADQITELNPSLDPQGLQVGQAIKLRP